MNSEQNSGQFFIEAIGIGYTLERREEGEVVVIKKEDFEKIFEKMNEMQKHINELQSQLIEELKRLALIKNLLNA